MLLSHTKPTAVPCANDNMYTSLLLTPYSLGYRLVKHLCRFTSVALGAMSTQHLRGDALPPPLLGRRSGWHSLDLSSHLIISHSHNDHGSLHVCYLHKRSSERRWVVR